MKKLLLSAIGISALIFGCQFENKDQKNATQDKADDSLYSLNSNELSEMYLTSTEAEDSEGALTEFDANDDGVLDEAERKAAKDAFIAKFDTDKDGKLSKEEIKAAILAKWDKNKDGVLSEEEREKMKEQWHAKFGKLKEKAKEKMKEIMAKFDTDGDGKLSDAEKEAMKDKMKEKVKDFKKNHKGVVKVRCEVFKKLLDEAQGNKETLQKLYDKFCTDLDSADAVPEKDGEDNAIPGEDDYVPEKNTDGVLPPPPPPPAVPEIKPVPPIPGAEQNEGSKDPAQSKDDGKKVDPLTESIRLKAKLMKQKPCS